ncbi:BTB/POZ domain-containing protein KCTD17 [Aphelenchoides avenae]|nr:BTB/POZ domain-containing protein KCTD17 [Aphelenchus avenae]
MASDEVPVGWVRLNVGGSIFVTRKETLSSSPFFARILEADTRKPDAKAGSATRFIDRDPDCFSVVLKFLRNGTLLPDRNCNLDELRFEADFYGLDSLVKIIDETKARNELRSATKCVVVSRNNGGTIEIAVSPREDNHFLLRHLRERYPCRVGASKFLFPYGFTFELKDCSKRLCNCSRDTLDAMLKDIVSVLEPHGYVFEQSPEKDLSPAGRSATSWTFVKREG